MTFFCTRHFVIVHFLLHFFHRGSYQACTATKCESRGAGSSGSSTWRDLGNSLWRRMVIWRCNSGVRADGVSESYLSGKAIELRMDAYFFEEEWGWEGSGGEQFPDEQISAQQQMEKSINCFLLKDEGPSHDNLWKGKTKTKNCVDDSTFHFCNVGSIRIVQF